MVIFLVLATISYLTLNNTALAEEIVFDDGWQRDKSRTLCEFKVKPGVRVLYNKLCDTSSGGTVCNHTDTGFRYYVGHTQTWKVINCDGCSCEMPLAISALGFKPNAHPSENINFSKYMKLEEIDFSKCPKIKERLFKACKATGGN